MKLVCSTFTDNENPKRNVRSEIKDRHISFGLKIYTLGIFWGSSDLSRIFLGLKKNTGFRFGFSLRSVDQKNIHSNFFQ